MFESDQYELLDFGDGEKLERFGEHVVRRRSPSVDHYSTDKRAWSSDFNFQREPQPQWHPTLGDDASWSIWHRNACFQLKQSPAGQVGVFPEQADNWDWIESCRSQIGGMRAINLFAYSGGTTMQLADCGVEVTHVDAAKPVVQWARHNAESSKVADLKVRWIVDDAVAYIGREVSRGSKYDIVVADPPSFGRGPKGAVWKLERDLPKLLRLLKEVAPDLKMLILSCHTPETNAADLRRLVNVENMTGGGRGETLSLRLRARSKRTLDNGECFRWKGF